MDDFQKLIGIVRRLHYPFKCVTSRAIEQKLLLCVCPGHAQHPLSVGERGGEIPDLLKLHVDLGFLTRGDICSPRSVEFITCSAGPQAVMPRLESRCRKSKVPLRIANDTDGDGRAGALQLE